MATEKMEIDAKQVNVKEEIEEESEQKMNTDIKEEIKEDSNKSETKPETVDVKNGIKKKHEILIEIVPKEAGLAYLKVDGMVVDDENVTMTAEEVRKYIEKSVLDQIEKNNPIDVLNKHDMYLQAEMKERLDEFQKLARLIDIIERDQLKFLRTDSNLQKYLTKTGGVNVNFAVLPSVLNAAANDALMKRGFPSQPSTVLKPASAPTRTTTPATIPASNTLVTPKATPKVPMNNAPKPAGGIECIDLTDESETPVAKTPAAQTTYAKLVKHPAPLPPRPYAASDKSWLPPPPKPRLRVSAEERGIVLQWDMIPVTATAAGYAQLITFDIFGYQEQKNLPINTLLWKKIGNVKAMTLPMACTLTQFNEGNTYHFSIRAVDVHNRCGAFSDPISIVYKALEKS